jgi:hypothetical protein
MTKKKQVAVLTLFGLLVAVVAVYVVFKEVLRTKSSVLF